MQFKTITNIEPATVTFTAKYLKLEVERNEKRNSRIKKSCLRLHIMMHVLILHIILRLPVLELERIITNESI